MGSNDVEVDVTKQYAIKSDVKKGFGAFYKITAVFEKGRKAYIKYAVIGGDTGGCCTVVQFSKRFTSL